MHNKEIYTFIGTAIPSGGNKLDPELTEILFRAGGVTNLLLSPLVEVK